VKREESICCGDSGGTSNITLPSIDPSSQCNDDKDTMALTNYFKVTLGGFSAATIINCLIMVFGFLTFGGSSQGVILNNYSTFDSGATICRFLTAVSVIGGYPFLISACRSEFLELMRIGATSTMVKRTTFVLLLLLTLVSMVISNAGFVIGLVGTVMGSAMVYIFPSVLYLSYSVNVVGGTKDITIRVERMFCRLLTVFGVVAALFGGSVSIINSYSLRILSP
jgi:amino acid permease